MKCNKQVALTGGLISALVCLLVWTCRRQTPPPGSATWLPENWRPYLAAATPTQDHQHQQAGASGPPPPAPPTTNRRRSPKILCWILTVDSASHRYKSQAVERTWAKRCDKWLLVQNGTSLRHLERANVLTLPIEHEGRDQLWHKVVKAFGYIHAHYLDQFDWFMKADDDTYVLVESLRAFLARKSSPDEPIYFGHRFKPYVKQGYMSGGSGYVLSRQALKRLVELGFQKKLAECHLESGQIEDMEMGQCLQAVGVQAGDTRDANGRETFLPLSPASLLNDVVDPHYWYFEYAYYDKDLKSGKGCCSSQPISFHYIEPRLMYLIDWLLYDVKKQTTTTKSK